MDVLYREFAGEGVLTIWKALAQVLLQGLVHGSRSASFVFDVRLFAWTIAAVREIFPSAFFTLEASCSPLVLVLFLFGCKDSPMMAMTSGVSCIPASALLFLLEGCLIGFTVAASACLLFFWSLTNSIVVKATRTSSSSSANPFAN